MIGRLRGALAVKSAEGVILDVNGVGYEVACPLTVLDRLPRLNETASLVIHTHLREDQLTLFGFGSEDERALFRNLIAISGIGPRLALACLSGLDAEALERAIIDQDTRRLSTIPGIGKRTAERLILELREKLQRRRPSRPASDDAATHTAPIDHLGDLDSALRNLGYRPKDVDTLMEQLRVDLEATGEAPAFESLLREALRRLRRP